MAILRKRCRRFIRGGNEKYATKARKFGGGGFKNLTADKSKLAAIIPSEFQSPDFKRHDALGLNYRISEFCAAVALAQFEKVDEKVKLRRDIAKIYKDVFNIRLALDKHIDHWDKRMLFFRLNKTTIEVVESKDEKEPSDSLWGLAWEVDNIDEAHKRLSADGIEVTSVKNGVKENTKVITVKSHCHGVPTLLIEHLN